MVTTKKSTARIAGLLYLALALSGMAGILIVPSTLGLNDPGADLVNIIAGRESLFRLGIFNRLLCQVLFVFLVLTLSRLFKEVNKALVLQMILLVVVSIPITFVLELCQVGALVLATEGDFSGLVAPGQVNSAIKFLFTVWGQGITIVEIFWGLWLIPFGFLVYQSGFIPRVLGGLLILGGVGYVATSVSLIVAPDFGNAIASYATLPPTVGEFSIILWLLIVGVREPKPVAI